MSFPQPLVVAAPLARATVTVGLKAISDRVQTDHIAPRHQRASLRGAGQMDNKVDAHSISQAATPTAVRFMLNAFSRFVSHRQCKHYVLLRLSGAIVDRCPGVVARPGHSPLRKLHFLGATAC